ncbi:1c17f1d4-95d7-478a-8e76-adfc9a26f8ae [Thermothielavioides terrestris]|uniref:non-specific serine/threonine protein kinase n=1 Tax=Thermothielavioides terrestris TaxID=2587410 RepID=A0A446BI81_9PEZI|nr:1c17f1d4-95d7-478a-8e76-adfc9a26f8ae [Thermothielavioides terrestris]
MVLADMLSTCVNRLKSVLGLSSKPLAQPARFFSEESISRYCYGGYHPVRIGDVFDNGKYKIVSKLGYGLYSTVWLACHLETRRHVALKILTADCYGQQQDTFELDILRQIKAQTTPHPGSNHILPLLDQFEHQGPNGKHVCLVFKAMGPDIQRYRRLFPRLRIPVPLVKDISRQLLLALAYLHDVCRVIHTDIKPQNILVETTAINTMFEQAPSEAFRSERPPLEALNDFYMESRQVSSAEEDLTQPTDLSVRLADFGTSSYFDRHLTEWIQPQMLRAPEVILGAEWDHKVDIWNLGVIVWELAEGKVLFDGAWTANAPYTVEAHLAQMTAIMGRMPEALLARSKNRNQYFDDEGKLLKPSTFPPCSLEQFSSIPGLSDAERKAYLDFVLSMLRLDPQQRPDAKSLLESEWLRQ